VSRAHQHAASAVRIVLARSAAEIPVVVPLASIGTQNAVSRTDEFLETASGSSR
jgi:hypothetical protein